MFRVRLQKVAIRRFCFFRLAGALGQQRRRPCTRIPNIRYRLTIQIAAVQSYVEILHRAAILTGIEPQESALGKHPAFRISSRYQSAGFRRCFGFPAGTQ